MHSLSELTALLRPYGAPSARMVQFLIEKEIVHAEGGGGRGFHREVPTREVGYAAIAAHLNASRFETAEIAEIIRQLRQEAQGPGRNTLDVLMDERSLPIAQRHAISLHVFRDYDGKVALVHLSHGHKEVANQSVHHMRINLVDLLGRLGSGGSADASDGEDA